MSSVQDTTPCPQCGGTAFVEFQTRTFAESLLCWRCGHTAYTFPLIDRQKQNADSEHRAWFKRRKDGATIFRTTQHAGYGAYRITQENGIGSIGVLNHKLTRRMIADFKDDLARPGIDSQQSYLTRWEPKARRVEVVVGQMPSTDLF